MRRAWRCARSTASTRPRTASCCTTRTCASAAATASTPARSGRRSFRRPALSACAARWTSALSAPAAPSPIAARPSSRSMAATACPRASCPPAPSATRSPTSRKASTRASPTRRPGTTRRSPMAASGRRATARAGKTRSRRGSSARTKTYASTSKVPKMRVFLLALAMQFAGAAWAQSEAQQQQQRQAEQPGNNAPVWRDVKSGEKNFTTIKGRETDVLVQPPARFPGQNVTATAGEAWRKFRNGPVTFYGGWLVVLVALAVLAFYFWKGPVKLQDRRRGRLIRRFSPLEQVVHWSTAISFCVLGISGLIMLFGKYLLLPVIGYTPFAC